ncbi:hypothetical protein MalM25_21070 [Planctomycetes bacterium MalM25]|nr:hypothetical protein MalM25_21070 [Planctomycetes bacterium MalM25]
MRQLLASVLSLVASLGSLTLPAHAAVTVLSNRTSETVTVRLTSGEGASQTVRLAASESKPFFSTSPLSASYATSSGPRLQPLKADKAYWFVRAASAGRRVLKLNEVGLNGDRPAPPQPGAWLAGSGSRDSTIPVVLCVDEEEPMRREQWQGRLKRRFEEAAAIVRAHSGVRFEVVGYERWQSDNRITRLEQTLAEFERSYSPPDRAVAIGFTSQYRVERGRRRLGGTRGPLRRHVLVKEWSPQVSEPERVELLVHELGHFLGAAHSPEPTSVMRPVLGDRAVRLKGVEVRFDAINTLAIAMVGEEVRRRGVRTLSEISATRQSRLQRIYATLSAITPGEPAAVGLLKRLRGARASDEVVSDADRTAAAARIVVSAVTRAASRNAKQPYSQRLAGDALTGRLIQAGAATDADPKALILGLGIALDNLGGLRINPRTRELVEQIESNRDRALRLNVLGQPTAQKRHDTLKHFIVSAALAVVVGEKEADLWGIGKELSDASGGSGFSFADLAANRAGVRFARGVTRGAPPVAGLARGCSINSFVPSLAGFEEGIKLSDLLKRFGTQDDPRFKAQIAEIDARIARLPAYSLATIGLPDNLRAKPRPVD